MIDNEDVLEFIELFNRYEVRYLLVGGYAVIHYAEPRYTKDIDFFIEPTHSNADKIIKVLIEFGLPEEQLDRTLFMSEGNFFKLGRPPWRIDLITSIAGVSFDSLYQNACVVLMNNHSVPVISRDDLITVKSIAGRPQDLLDIEKLTRKV